MLHRQNLIIMASIAQMVERKTLNLVVVGSIPTGGGIFFTEFIKSYFIHSICIQISNSDTLAEWLRRRPAKPLGFARVGSNPTGVVFL